IISTSVKLICSKYRAFYFILLFKIFYISFTTNYFIKLQAKQKIKTMRKIFFSALSLVSFIQLAQNNDPIVMKVGGKPIYKSEFQTLYNKNNNKSIDKKSVEEYAQMYALYKMK